MMLIAEAQLGIGPATHLVSHHECADPSHVTLKRQHLQIQHQSGVIRKVCRDANRLLHLRQFPRGLLLCHPDLLLDTANRIGILIELQAIAFSDRSHQSLEILRDEVEDAAVFPDAHRALDGIGAVADQPFEHGAGPVFHRQRRLRSTPGDRVVVHAAVGGFARAHHRHLQPDFQDGSCVCLPSSFAAIWSTETPQWISAPDVIFGWAAVR